MHLWVRTNFELDDAHLDGLSKLLPELAMFARLADSWPLNSPFSAQLKIICKCRDLQVNIQTENITTRDIPKPQHALWTTLSIFVIKILIYIFIEKLPDLFRSSTGKQVLDGF